jgi:putative FmdB family regulatory protein
MPIYEFGCIKCNNQEEIMRNYEDPLPTCKECEVPMFRMISTSTFILKGEGWEKDGYTKQPTKDNKGG